MTFTDDISDVVSIYGDFFKEAAQKQAFKLTNFNGNQWQADPENAKAIGQQPVPQADNKPAPAAVPAAQQNQSPSPEPKQQTNPAQKQNTAMSAKQNQAVAPQAVPAYQQQDSMQQLGQRMAEGQTLNPDETKAYALYRGMPETGYDPLDYLEGDGLDEGQEKTVHTMQNARLENLMGRARAGENLNEADWQRLQDAGMPVQTLVGPDFGVSYGLTPDSELDAVTNAATNNRIEAEMAAKAQQVRSDPQLIQQLTSLAQQGEQLTPDEWKILKDAGVPVQRIDYNDGRTEWELQPSQQTTQPQETQAGQQETQPAAKPVTTMSEDMLQRINQPDTASVDDYTNFGTQYGINEDFMASDAFRKDMSDEQRIAYLSAAIAKDVRDFSEANGTVGDWVDTKMNGVIDKVDGFLTGADDDLSNFIKSTFFGMEISPEGRAEAQAGLDARTQARQDALKTRFLNKYLASKHGQAVVDKVLDAAPLSTVKQMVDTMKNQTGSVKLSDQATQLLENKVKQKCYNAMSEDFFGNLPQVASLWFKSKGMDTLSGWAENPWIFYSGLLAILLGGGALIGGGLGLFGGGGGGGSTVVVQQSPQDSYRQNLYKTF